MSKSVKIIFSGLAVFALLASVFYIDQHLYAQINLQNRKIASLETQLILLRQDQANRIDSLSQNVQSLNKDSAATKEELARRQVVQEKSQQDMLTASVAGITPAVVSIVISKDVPQLEITYENPFGDDPFFKDFGAQIPVYKQSGTKRQDIGAATGFLIKSSGYILTNKHVAGDTNAYYTVLLSNGSQKNAQVIYQDPNNDIAILKIPGSGYTTAQLGDSNTLVLGETVFAVGNALGEYNNSVSVGIISGLNRQINASGANGATETLNGVIQTDAAINPGNSGGPLVDLSGQVIGINVATVSGSNNISFSIPINSVKNIIKTVLK